MLEEQHGRGNVLMLEGRALVTAGFLTLARSCQQSATGSEPELALAIGACARDHPDVAEAGGSCCPPLPTPAGCLEACRPLDGLGQNDLPAPGWRARPTRTAISCGAQGHGPCSGLRGRSPARRRPSAWLRCLPVLSRRG